MQISDYFPLGQDFVTRLAEDRDPILTPLMQTFSLIGEIEGYMLVFILVFCLYSQRLAVQAALVVLSSMTLNHLLKIWIQNPRPFVADGGYLEHWAVSTENAMELVAEYSTPSGHAMAASAFYVFLFGRIRNTAARIACVVAILLTGISRPYIGVHFAEDIVLGWAIGACFGLLALTYLDRAMLRWEHVGTGRRALFTVGFGLAVWAFTLWHLDRPLEALPTAFISYLGFLFGILLIYSGARLSSTYLDTLNSPTTILGRVVIMTAIVVATLVSLEAVFDWMADEHSLMGQALRYVRYALVAAAGVLLTIYSFNRLQR